MRVLALSSKKHKAQAVGGLLFCAIFAAVALHFGPRSFAHVQHLRARQTTLSHMAFALAQQNEATRRRIARLQFDDHYIEQIARQRLGLVKPGDIVYRTSLPQAEMP